MKAKKLIAVAAVALMALAPALSQAQGATAARGGAAGGVGAGAVVGGFTLVTLIFAGSTKGTSGT